MESETGPPTSAAGQRLRTPGSILTVGHSKTPLPDFIAILQFHAVSRILDIRRYPASRKWPHFGAAALAGGLADAGIDYVGLPELGGRRRPQPDSPHVAWREEGFRGYADFMETAEFTGGLARAMALATERSSALMCAEALPWKCHRSLVADALLARGWKVADILSRSDSRPHRLPRFARLEGERVIYDGAARLLL